MKLLVIEDDERTVRLLRQGLGESGFAVNECRNGADGLASAFAQAYDLIVLDVMLPGKDGWAVLTEMRESGLDTPVVMLTARDAVEHRVRGLNNGADDYVVKPFAFSELLVRIRNILRRRQQTVRETLECEDLVLDPARAEVSRARKPIDLTFKEFRLLELLLRHQGEILSRAYISEQVWDMALDGDSNVIEVNIRRLRSKMDEPFTRRLIHTVRGRGYVIR
jgi:two-component system copper resistance phosphate regulon response regulator CusR